MQRCSVQACERPASTTLEGHSFCREHFFAQCYERLDQCARWLVEKPVRDPTIERMRGVLTECTRRATEVSQVEGGLDNLERARVLDILLLASELSHHLRRGPRRVASIAVRLRSQRLGHAWEEETRTVMLSRHGALVECAHPVEVGEALILVRLDKDRQAAVRVAWSQKNEHGNFEVGLELMTSDNFWEIDWSTVQ